MQESVRAREMCANSAAVNSAVTISSQRLCRFANTSHRVYVAWVCDGGVWLAIEFKEVMNTRVASLIKCPESGEYLTPVKVWESHLPNGTAIQYGQFSLHHHRRVECPWSLLVVVVEEQQ